MLIIFFLPTMLSIHSDNSKGNLLFISTTHISVLRTDKLCTQGMCSNYKYSSYLVQNYAQNLMPLFSPIIRCNRHHMQATYELSPYNIIICACITHSLLFCPILFCRIPINLIGFFSMHAKRFSDFHKKVFHKN